MDDYNIGGENKGFVVDTGIADSAPEASPNRETSLTKEIFEWLDVLAKAIIAVVIIFSLLFRVATIDGDSMKSTLFSEDKVIITNLAYEPKLGDIVVISRNADNSVESVGSSDMPIIKRVIAVGGQTVDIDFDRGVVSVDGAPLDEPYVNTPTNRHYDIKFPVYVPEGYIFVLGDNRNESLDSRASSIGENGLIDTRYVLGHAVLRIFPFNKIERLNK